MTSFERIRNPAARNLVTGY